MGDFFRNLFDKEKGNLDITFLSVWHIMYLVLIVGLTILVAVLINKKSKEFQGKVVKWYAYAALAVYVADFFIMPLYMDKIDIDKLPFHICTLMSPIAVMTVVSDKLKGIRTPIAVLSLVASMMYITYPGSAIGGISPFVYKVVQTFVFHGLLFGYGFLSISTKIIVLDFKKIWKELVALCCIALWAAFGNAVYYDLGPFDWFFITGSTFPFVPKAIMPFVVIICIFALVAIIYLLQKLFEKIVENKKDINKNSI